MTNAFSKTKHHCPKKSKGNCYDVYTELGTFCGKHQTGCLRHKEVHLQTEECRGCKKKRESDEKREREARKAQHATRKSSIDNFLGQKQGRKKPQK
jgi:hypothetical protein